MQLDALRWKLSASKASQSAATQMAPMMALLDTWALTEQMRQFFATGSGATLFGTEQGVAREVAERLRGRSAPGARRDVRRRAGALSGVRGTLHARASIHRSALCPPVRRGPMGRGNESAGEPRGRVGTVSQSMSDISERFRMFGQSAPSQAAWEVRLALGDARPRQDRVNRTFAQADESLDRLSRLAESSPGTAARCDRGSAREHAGRFRPF